MLQQHHRILRVLQENLPVAHHLIKILELRTEQGRPGMAQIGLFQLLEELEQELPHISQNMAAVGLEFGHPGVQHERRHAPLDLQAALLFDALLESDGQLRELALHLPQQPLVGGQPGQQVNFDVVALLGSGKGLSQHGAQPALELGRGGNPASDVAWIKVMQVGLRLVEDLLEKELTGLLSPPRAQVGVVADVVHPHRQPGKDQRGHVRLQRPALSGGCFSGRGHGLPQRKPKPAQTITNSFHGSQAFGRPRQAASRGTLSVLP